MSNPIPPAFQDAFDALSAAVATAQGAGEYYQQLPVALEGINKELLIISNKIDRIVTELANKTAQVAANDATIRDLTGRSAEITNELAASRAETAAIRHEREDIERQVAQLNAEKEAQLAQQQDELARLQEEHREILEREKRERQTSSQGAISALAEKERENSEQQAILRKEMEDDKAVSQAKLAELQRQADELNARAQTSKDEVVSLTASKEQLAQTIQRLEVENAQLKTQILEASRVMESAKLILQQLTPQNRDEINRQISQLKDHIGIINGILVSGAEGPGGAAANPRISPGGLSYDMKLDLKPIAITKEYKLGGLIKKVRESNWPDAKISAVTQKLENATTMGEINQAFDGLDKTILSRGGRKTRRHKKRSRKTRRKQRGGFKYSAHARRTSITTSRRRSSRPTSTTSRRTTRSSSR